MSMARKNLKVILIAICSLCAYEVKADTCGDLCSAVWWVDGPDAADVRSKLEKNNQNVHATGYRDRSPLHLASLHGDAKTVQLLLDFEANVMARTTLDYTPLHRARTVEIAKTLIQAGAEIDAESTWGTTPLFSVVQNISKGRDKELISFLIAAGADVNAIARDMLNATPLHFAAEQPILDTIITLIEAGANINAQNTKGHTPAHFAAAFGHTESLSTLFALGADKKIIDSNGKTALDLLTENKANASQLLAIVARDTRLFQKKYEQNRSRGQSLKILNAEDRAETKPNPNQMTAAQTVDLKCGNLCDHDWWWTATTLDLKAELISDKSVLARKGADGGTPLHYANQATPAAYKALIDAGADINARHSRTGETPLHRAAANSYEHLRLLLDAGADVTAQDKAQNTPLHYTGYFNLSNKISDLVGRRTKLLLEAGANANARNSEGDTPLHTASSAMYNPGDIRALVAAGADINSPNNEGKTPLHSVIGKAPNSERNIKVLLDSGANVNSKELNGDTPLHLAAKIKRKKRQLKQITLLLEAGADAMAKNERGNTPLHLASFNVGRPKNDTKTIAILLRYGSDLSAKNYSGHTPLHLATGHCRVKMTKALLKSGADVMILSDNRDTVLHSAILATANNTKVNCSTKKQAQIIKLLIDAGANVNFRNKNGQSPWDLAKEKNLQNTRGYTYLEKAYEN
ncbi:MAG: ankyrin repeat domain-containing protein [Paracoccaceae bacterium]|nr:ankyrin repeat domain-containing protein [Paracoccaceae bacterium]